MDKRLKGQCIKESWVFLLLLLTAPVCVTGGWTRGLMCPSQRDEFEVPNLEDLRLEIPGKETLTYNNNDLNFLSHKYRDCAPNLFNFLNSFPKHTFLVISIRQIFNKTFT